MKIAILTFSQTTNYGAALQCYALSKYLQNLGHNIIIFNIPLIIEQKEKLSSLSSFFKISRNILSRLKRLIIVKKDTNAESIRYVRNNKEKKEDAYWDEQTRLLFKSFNEKYLPTFTKEFLTENDLCDNYPKADLYIVGSDQVWNPSITQKQKNIFFFSFLKDEPRISYAASFGGSSKWNLSQKENKEIQFLLEKFKGISVRENNGITILNNIFKLKGQEVLDPTLLLSTNDYIKLAQNSQLDGTSNLYAYKFIINDIWLSTLHFIAQETSSTLRMDCETIHLRNVPFNPTLSIEGWLKLIQTSKFIVTDSFHCTVFCVLFRKQFLVTPSYPGGEGRMLSFLKKLGLEDRFYFTTQQIRSNPNNWKRTINYDEVYKRLYHHKDLSIKYLMKYL